MRNGDTRWKAERNQSVMIAVLGGHTYQQTAELFGISKAMVRAVLIGCAERGMFVPSQKRMPGIYRRLYGLSTWALTPEGLTHGPTDFKYQRMLKMVQKTKVEKRAKGRPASSMERDAQILEALEFGATPTEVAEKFGLDVQRIYQIRKKGKTQ